MADVATEKDRSAHVENIDEQAARADNQVEHNETPWQAVKAHPWTLAWCIYAIWVLICNSFENQASGSILGIPQFRKDFGYFYGDSYVLSANWQAAFTGAPAATGVIGSFGGGWIADKIGRRLCFVVAMLISVVGITLEVVATTNLVFFLGKLINGFAVGGFISVAFTYIGEISPTALRGIVSSAAAVAFTIGPLIVALIVRFTGNGTSRWAYRGIFVAQYGVLAVAAAGVFFMPESPWWLLTKGKEARAIKNLRKLGYSAVDAEARAAAILLTLEESRRETEGTTYLECFHKSNLRRTIISVMPLSITALSGIFFVASYSTYYYESAGFSTEMSFTLQIIQQVVSMLGNFAAWFLVDKVGRRSLTFYGLAFITIVLFLIGGLAVQDTPGSLIGACALMIFYCFVYNATIGATGYTILTEVATSRLRVKTIAISLALQSSIYTMWAFTIPHLFNPDQANLGGKITFIFGGFAVLSLIYLWFYQPETAGRTYEELDELFIKKIPARKFKKTKTDAEMKGIQAVEGVLEKA